MTDPTSLDHPADPPEPPAESIRAKRKVAGEGSHAPQLSSRFKRLLGRFHFSGVFWYRFHMFGVRLLPEWLLGPTLRLFSFLFFLALGNSRRAVTNNLAWTLGPAPGFLGNSRRAFRTIHNHAWCLTETYEGLGGEQPEEPQIEGENRWQALIDSGSGFVMVTAHVGHWEVGSRQGKATRPVHVVREPEMDPEAQAFLGELLSRAGGGQLRIHYSGVGDLALGSRLLDALRRGEIVALQCDRPGTGGRIHQSKLFGLPFSMPLGPAALARLANVPLVPVFVFRQGRKLSRVIVREPIYVEQGVDRDRALGQTVDALATQVEWAIRRQPNQWFCFRDLWGPKPST